MSSDRLRQLAIALVCMVVLWGLVSVLRGGSGEITEDGFTLPAFVADELTEITISGRGDSITLTRLDDGWLVNGYEATPALIDRFIGSLSDADVRGELISISVGSHERLGVTESTGKFLRLVDASGPTGSFFAGNSGTGFGTLFVRRPDSDSTFLLRSGLGNHVSRSVDDWREHEIISIDPETVSSIEVSRGRASYVLVRGGGDSGWHFSDGARADSAAVVRMLGRFRSLQATGFASSDDSVNFDNPDIVVGLTDSSGTEILRLELDSTATGYWVKEANDSTVFELVRWSVLQLAPADSLFR